MSNSKKNENFHINIDCSLLLQDMSGEKRYCWAQRNLSVNNITKINSESDFDNLIEGNFKKFIVIIF